jgi:hypothetical protein
MRIRQTVCGSFLSWFLTNVGKVTPRKKESGRRKRTGFAEWQEDGYREILRRGWRNEGAVGETLRSKSLSRITHHAF